MSSKILWKHKEKLYNTGTSGREFKSEIKKVVKGSKNSEEQKNIIKNIKRRYESREKVIKLFDDYSRILMILKLKQNKINTKQNMEEVSKY